GTGLPLVSLITPGQAGDSPMLLPLLAQLRVTRPVGRPRTRPAAVLGDKAYSSRAIRTHLRARGIKAVIPEP
ncbi:transposase, partial [Micrococcus luteus]